MRGGVLLFLCLNFLSFSYIDLSYKWKVLPKELKFEEIKEEEFIPAEVFLSREYKIKNPRIPEKIYWFLFEINKPEDTSIPYFIHFKEGPVVKSVYFNGVDITKYRGKGIDRGGWNRWNIFGHWYIIPSNLWKVGKNEILVSAYDVRFLNDNIFGEVYFGKADLYRLIRIIRGDFGINSYNDWYGYIEIKNISPFPLKFNFSYTPFDYFGVILDRVKEKTVELPPGKRTRLTLPCRNKNTYKFLCKFKNNLGEFSYSVYVLPPYKETETRKIWCLDTPNTRKSYRKYFWEILKWKKDSPLKFPPPENGWEKFSVPRYYREKLEKLHRIWMRTYFDIDKIEKNRRYYLYFESVYEDCEIWVNRKKCGEHKQSEIPFYIDITDKIKEGKNELLLGITGWIANLKPEYPKPVLGVTKSVGSRSLIRPGWPRATYPIGITKSVYLEELPEIWIKNTLIRTWISRNEIEIILRIKNDKDEKEKVSVLPEILFKGKRVKKFDKFEVEIEGKSEIEKKISYKWKPDKLWTPETPNLYQLNIKLLKGEDLIDEDNYRFGAREWKWEKDKIYLNGKEIKIYEEYAPGLGTGFHTKYSINGSYRLFSNKKSLGQFSNRYFYYVAKETLDVADEIGFIVGQEGGLGANGGTHYAYQDKRLKESMLKVFRAKIWERGNHPSIILWNTGNECYAPWLAKAEWLDEIEEAIHKMDPTRLVTNDRQFDLEGKAMLANPHYPWYGVLPQDAYYYGKPEEIPREERERRKRQFETNPGPMEKLEIEGKINTLSTWNHKTPIWIGEFSWISERNIPGYFASLWGEDVMTYKPVCTWHKWSFGSLAGVSKEREFLYIGYRQCGVNSFHAHCWATVQPEALSPMAVFPREFSKQFYGGEKVIRNLSIHNDTFKNGNFKVECRLIERWKNNEVFKKEFNLYLDQFEIKWKKVEIKLPDVKERKEFIFQLILYFNGKKVYKKDYIWEIVPREEIENLKKGLKLVKLYDTEGETEDAFRKLGIKYRKIDGVENLKESDVLVIGQNSLDEKIKENSEYLMELVRKGLTIIFLGQNYLGKTEPITFGSFNFKYPAQPIYTSTAYPVSYSHPVMKNFDYYDFCLWGDNHIVAFELFDMPSKGNFKPLILTNRQNRSRGLTLPCLIEFPSGKGSIYFCQMDLINKCGKVPASDQLLIQLIKYGKYKKHSKTFAVIETKDGNLSSAFKYNLGIKEFKKYEKIPDLKEDILFLGERDEKLRKEIENKMEMIVEYVKNGGTLYICDLSEDDKEWFEKLIGGKLEFKFMPTTQAKKINYDSLIDGITNEQLIFLMISATPIEKRKPNPVDIVRKVPLIKTNYPATPIIYPEGIWKIKIGNGSVIIDNTRWRICNFPSANRFACLLLTNLGIEIKPEIKISKKVDYSKFISQYNTFFIDIKNFANWSYIDDPQKPGWIGAGPYRDLRDIPKGKVKFLGIPFYIISPEENNGKTIISLYGPDRLIETKEIPVNRKVDILIFLHSAAWVQAKEGEPLMKYIIRYDKEVIPPEKPPEEIIEVKRNYHIDDWWYIGMKEDYKLKEGEVAWAKNFSGHKAGIFLQIWKNPKPQLPIKWIKIKAEKNAQVFVFAITGAVKK